MISDEDISFLAASIDQSLEHITVFGAMEQELRALRAVADAARATFETWEDSESTDRFRVSTSMRTLKHALRKAGR